MLQRWHCSFLIDILVSRKGHGYMRTVADRRNPKVGLCRTNLRSFVCTKMGLNAALQRTKCVCNKYFKQTRNTRVLWWHHLPRPALSLRSDWGDCFPLVVLAINVLSARAHCQREMSIAKWSTGYLGAICFIFSAPIKSTSCVSNRRISRSRLMTE